MPTTLPLAEKFEGHETFSKVAEKLGCSYYAIRNLDLGGFLESLETHRGKETTVELVYEAWRKRAEAKLNAKGVKAYVSASAQRNVKAERTSRAKIAAEALGVSTSEW